MSLLPLVVGLSMRLTETVDRKRKLFKGRRCWLESWVPHPDEAKLEIDGEWVLSHMPVVIYVSFEERNWEHMHEDVSATAFPMTPSSRTWKVNKQTGVCARRTGYFLIPDFGSTSHMI